MMLVAWILSTALAGGNPCHEYLDSDLNRDGTVNLIDLLDLLLCYGQPACDGGDVDRDNDVDATDLLMMLNAFGLRDEDCGWVEICSVADLEGVREVLGGNYKIVCDLNFPADWTPIGVQVFPFSGAMVAEPGITLNNLRINHPDDDLGTGLFAWAVGARLLDLHLVNANVEGGEFVGALAGYAVAGARVEGCTVQGQVQGDRYTGGLVGRIRSAKIINCHTDVTVRATYGSSYFTGCIVGQVYTGLSIVSRCSSICDVPLAWRDVGGIAGQMTSGTIRRCWADVDIDARGALGGICGDSFGLIEDCWATGSIIASTNTIPWCGGTVGAAFARDESLGG